MKVGQDQDPDLDLDRIQANVWFVGKSLVALGVAPADVLIRLPNLVHPPVLIECLDHRTGSHLVVGVKVDQEPEVEVAVEAVTEVVVEGPDQSI